MKLKLMASSIVLSLSLSAGAKNLSEAEVQPIPDSFTKEETMERAPITGTSSVRTDPVTMAVVGNWFLDAAKDAILGKAKSLLKDALFGSSGPSYVMLHEEALRQIEAIVTEVVLTSDVENAKSQLLSFEDMLDYYSASAQDDTPDLSVLPILIDYATSLKNHQAYRDSYNPNAHLLTESYSLVASLTMSVLTEKHLQGDISEAYLSAVALELANSLSSMGSKASNYVYNRIGYSAPNTYCGGIIIHKTEQNMDQLIENVTTELNESVQSKSMEFGNRCYYRVTDSFTSRTYIYQIADYGQNLARRLALQKRTSLINEYKNKFMGSRYNQILASLNSF